MVVPLLGRLAGDLNKYLEYFRNKYCWINIGYVKHLEDDPGLLEQVGPHGGADDLEALAEVDLDVFAEPEVE